MRFVLAAVVLLHGLVHLMGFGKAFHLAPLPDLKLPVSRPLGVVWLAAAASLCAAAALLAAGADRWWWAAAPGLVLSQLAIVASWRDARFGTIANLVIAAALVPSLLEALPGSLTNRFRAAARTVTVRGGDAPVVTDADLDHLPEPVQRYVRVSGAVGKPLVRNFRAVFAGEFRNGPAGRWMTFRSEQVNSLDPPARFFLMRASVFGVPIAGLHMFGGGGATMRIKVASLLQVADARGPEMDQGETVTLFNDMCLLAPASLVDRKRIRWESAGRLAARAAFTHRGRTIRADLAFDEAGELADFVSHDRFLSSDGKTYESRPWSTPVRGYRDVAGRRVPVDVETVWSLPSGPFVYGRFRLVELAYDVGAGD